MKTIRFEIVPLRVKKIGIKRALFKDLFFFGKTCIILKKAPD